MPIICYVCVTFTIIIIALGVWVSYQIYLFYIACYSAWGNAPSNQERDKSLAILRKILSTREEREERTFRSSGPLGLRQIAIIAACLHLSYAIFEMTSKAPSAPLPSVQAVLNYAQLPLRPNARSVPVFIDKYSILHVPNHYAIASLFTLNRAVGGGHVLAVRGTSTMNDVFSNLNIPFRHIILGVSKHNAAYLSEQVGEARVHEGFAQIADIIIKQLPKSREWLKSLSITGHSLGAGIAAIVTVKLAIRYNVRLRSTVLFAAPRAGNAHFLKMLGESVSEVVVFHNYADIIPNTPLVNEPNLVNVYEPFSFSSYSLMKNVKHISFTYEGSLHQNHALLTYLSNGLPLYKIHDN